jgi:hypothetical protein
MHQEDAAGADASKRRSRAHVVRLPGFVREDEIGLGDVIKHVTRSFGIGTCGGCERRAATLNRWLAFSGRRR